MKVALATLKTLGFEQDFLGDWNVLQNTFILIELEGKIPLEAYNSWVIEKERLKIAKITPNLENFTTFYGKLVDTQADAMYIRKQLEEMNRGTSEPTSSSKNTQNTVVLVKRELTR